MHQNSSKDIQPWSYIILWEEADGHRIVLSILAYVSTCINWWRFTTAFRIEPFSSGPFAVRFLHSAQALDTEGLPPSHALSHFRIPPREYILEFVVCCHIRTGEYSTLLAAQDECVAVLGDTMIRPDPALTMTSAAFAGAFRCACMAFWNAALVGVGDSNKRPSQ